jgi:RNA polymerase sigma factor (sigma-70 family)
VSSSALHEPGAEQEGAEAPSTVSKVGARHRKDPSPPAPPAEFTAFYSAHAPRLVAFLRFQGATFSDAADCAQEALTLCFQEWADIKHPYAWSRKVASRRFFREQSTAEMPTDDVERPGQTLLPANVDLEALENRYTLLRLIGLLPLRQRQVVAWTYDGAKTSEIAEALEITPTAVRSNLHKARSTLRKYLRAT